MDYRDNLHPASQRVNIAHRFRVNFEGRLTADWQKHGRAAPFRRNDQLLDLLPKGVIAFPGGGITGNIVDKARQRGIPVMKAAT